MSYLIISKKMKLKKIEETKNIQKNFQKKKIITNITQVMNLNQIKIPIMNFKENLIENIIPQIQTHFEILVVIKKMILKAKRLINLIKKEMKNIIY